MYKFTKGILLEKYVKNRMTCDEIADEIGCNKETVRYHLKKHGIKLRPAKKRTLNLTGEKFGYLTVECMSFTKGTRCKCKCVCGKILYLKAGDLRWGNYKSCGCRKTKRGSQNPQWKGCGELSGYVWAQIKHSARTSNKQKNVEITIEEAWNKLQKQNLKCALSGMPISLGKTADEHRRGLTTASLDRIDSSGHYTLDNVQWVHKDINKLKTDFPEGYFIKLCKLVACHQI